VDQALTSTEEAALQRAADLGYQIVPPDENAWTPAFKPQHYEADPDSTVYCRVDLPDNLYYALRDAAEQGLADAEKRVIQLRGIERALDDRVREQRNQTRPSGLAIQKEPPPLAVLDGLQLEPREVRALVMAAEDKAKRFREAVERMDTRRV
jgi:hypothetical protein